MDHFEVIIGSFFFQDDDDNVMCSLEDEILEILQGFIKECCALFFYTSKPVGNILRLAYDIFIPY